MLTNRGETGRRRRVRLVASEAATKLSPWIQALGYEVTDDDAELQIVCGPPCEIPETDIPTILVMGPGARAAVSAKEGRLVLNARSHLLDLATALKDLLFDSHASHRRYCREQAAGVRVLFEHGAGAAAGRLVCVSRLGAFVITEETVAPEVKVELEVLLPDRSAPLRARSVFSTCQGSESGFAVEFALEAPDVAPSLSTWLAPEPVTAESLESLGLSAG